MTEKEELAYLEGQGMSWDSATLGDVIELNYGKGLPERKRVKGDIPVYGSGGIVGSHTEALVTGPGIIVGRKGTVGLVYWETRDFFPIDTVYYVSLGKSDVDFRFIYYLLKSLPLATLNTDAAVPGLNRDNALRLKIKIPLPEEQERIASILSAYDDLIENNRRRIQLLEQAARLLYKEWFIYLRFPGHEHVNIVDGMPERWEKKKISDVADSINYGYTASATKENVGPKFLRITDIVPEILDWSSVPFCQIPEDKKEKYLLQEGNIVVARTGATTGYAKRIGTRHPESVFASYLVRIRLSDQLDDCIAGIFLESEEYKNFIKAHLGGAAQPNANAKIISSAVLLVPPKNIQRDFREAVEPIFNQKELLQIQNEKLKEARDLLLPRLMNGELAV